MFKALLAIAGSFFLIKYRTRVVGVTGKFAWCEKFLGDGGTYRFVLIFAILLFFWGVAKLTGTEDVFMSPLTNFFNLGRSGGGGGDEWGF